MFEEMKRSQTWEKDGFIMRLAEEADAERYWKNYDPLDPEVVRLTGCKESFTKDEVLSFFYRSIEDEERYFFLVFDPEGNVIGESVLNEIDVDLRSANFRIGIFHGTERGKGIGTWMVSTTRDFAFEVLQLHRLELDVFSFNPRAIRAYRRAGFREEGVRRDAVRNGDGYGDDVLMSILEDEWREMKLQTCGV